MTRRNAHPSISSVAADILREVEAEDQVKIAETQLLRGTLAAQVPSTELGDELRKLATVCRTQTDDVSYADLQEFLTNAR